jgi:hypothetical protein
VAKENSIELGGTSLFYYEVHDMGFDGQSWSPHEAEPSLPTNVVPPQEKVLEGFDVVTFYAKNAPECSPLSCNGMLKKFERIGIASLNRLARRTIDFTKGHSTTLNRAPTASSRFIQ